MPVSIDDDAAAWKKMVNEKNMNGIHLLAEAGLNSRINQAYNMNAVPMYMMGETEGKFIDANAPRPNSED